MKYRYGSVWINFKKRSTEYGKFLITLVRKRYGVRNVGRKYTEFSNIIFQPLYTSVFYAWSEASRVKKLQLLTEQQQFFYFCFSWWATAVFFFKAKRKFPYLSSCVTFTELCITAENGHGLRFTEAGFTLNYFKRPILKCFANKAKIRNFWLKSTLTLRYFFFKLSARVFELHFLLRCCRKTVLLKRKV